MTWYACEHSEQPTDAYVCWHYRGCVGCRVKAEALAMRHPDDSHVVWLNRMVAVTP